MQEKRSDNNSLEKDADDIDMDISSLSQSQSSPSPFSSNCNSDNDENHSTKKPNSAMPTIAAISIGDLSNDIQKTQNTTNANNNILTGVIVNGFHPQLYKWKEKSYPLNNAKGGNGKNRHSKRSRESSSLEERIQEKVSRARNDTVKDLHNIQNARGTEVATTMLNKEKPSILKMYADMFEKSSVPQLITAPGGRIAACKCFLQNK